MTNQNIYLDNAATTPLRQEVKDRMVEIINGPFGNPSSTHQFGRKSRIVVESCRKYIASAFNCSSSEIIFTSGGTESDNTALLLAVRDLGVRRIITSPIEHHAILHAAESIRDKYAIELELLKVDSKGNPDIQQLEELLQAGKKTLVSLMHANNELGNILDLKHVGNLCHQFGAYFHSDTVQSIGQLPLDLSDTSVDFISASAHKFYGPKGVGFLYVNSSIKTSSFITGGAQERNMRGGTENIIGLAGMHTALEFKMKNFESEREHLRKIKSYMIEQLEQRLGDHISFNGNSADLDLSLHKILSVSFPKVKDDMLLFNLDLRGIAASGGSACASGSLQGSHVISAIDPLSTHPVIRFSFGKDTTLQDINTTLEVLETLIN